MIHMLKQMSQLDRIDEFEPNNRNDLNICSSLYTINLVCQYPLSHLYGQYIVQVTIAPNNRIGFDTDVNH